MVRSATLYVFAISHFCEKARWALDHFDVPYAARNVAPGQHAALAARLRAPETSLPLLTTPDRRVIQGADEILRWAESVKGPDAATLQSDARETDAQVRRLEDVLGRHIGRHYYSSALLEQATAVRSSFARDLPTTERMILRATWGPLKRRMRRGLDLGPAQMAQSKAVIGYELSWLDGLLADGRASLQGDGFSRLDMTAASLLAPLARPAEHPFYADAPMTKALEADYAAWAERPALRWTRAVYAQWRRRALAAA